MSVAFHGFFDIQPASNTVTSPPATHQKAKTQPPSAIELDEYTFGTCYNGPIESSPQSPRELPSGMHTPFEPPTPIPPNELEMSRPPSPKRDEAVGLMQSWNNPPMNKWRILSCCLIYFGNGINDSGMFFQLYKARLLYSLIELRGSNND